MAADYHMSADEFRRRGHALIDWIADYQSKVGDYPVLSQATPGQVRAALPAEPPRTPESFDDILADVESIIMPGITHWQSPNFFAYFPCNASGPGILGELLSAGLNVQGMLWATSPACTELETHVLDWVAQLLDLPTKFRSSERGGGCLQDSASSATLVSLLAARELYAESSAESMVAYASVHAHSSIEKAARIAGIGHVRKIAADSAHALLASDLAAQLERDRAQGLVPIYVCATLGTTSSLAFDPVAAVGAICRARKLWLHVDAAMAGTAAICPEFRFGHDGLELADSYTFNPHKWMFTNFDCNCLFVADRDKLTAALSITPEYLRNQATESGAVFDYRDWQIPLGRRFRALKLWFVLRHYGAEGLQHHVREHVKAAQWLSTELEQSDAFEVVTETALNLVCFRHVDGDAASARLLATINESGRAYLSHTVLDGAYVIRLCVGQTHTTQTHVEDVLALILEVSGTDSAADGGV